MNTNFECGKTTVKEMVDRFDDDVMVEVSIAGAVGILPIERGHKNDLSKTLDNRIFCKVTMRDDNVLEIVL